MIVNGWNGTLKLAMLPRVLRELARESGNHWRLQWGESDW
jgi:hypothetical protein